MEDYLKTNLNLETIRSLGACGGGCISDARAYSTDVGELFVKQNDDVDVSYLYGLLKLSARRSFY